MRNHALASTAFLVLASFPFVAHAELVAGDVDLSGDVNAVDVQLVINDALGLAVAYACDVDQSAQTNAIDVQIVINAALGLPVDDDGDGLCDGAEANLGTQPDYTDTDGDGVSDGQEVLVDETNPLGFDFTVPSPVSGAVELPGGSSLNPEDLKVVTNVGDASVAANGAFSAQVNSDGPTLAQLVDTGDEPIFLGFLDPAKQDGAVSAHSTAEVLLFFALGGWTTPPNVRDDLLGLIAATPECEALAQAIAAAVAANPHALVDGDAAIHTALTDAHQALTAQPAKAKAPAGEPASRKAASTLVLLEPDASTLQSGLQVLHNPNGDGIVVQNNYRRRATLFAYKTGTKDEEGTLSELVPPQQVGDALPIPTTFRLEIVSSITAALQGQAPWAPITAGPLDLPKAPSSEQTIYELVVLGGTLNAFSDPSIMNDPRFYSFAEEWTEEFDNLAWDTFWWDFAFPIVQLVGVGATCQSNINARSAELQQFRGTLDPELLARGIPLPLTSPDSYQGAILAVLESIRDNALVNEAFLGVLVNAWGPINASRANLDRLEANLRRATRVGGLITAIDLAMTALDLGAVIWDLQSSEKADSWEATVIERRVRLEPSAPIMRPTNLRVTLTASVNGLPDEVLCYKWTYHGNRGFIVSDHGDVADTDGASFVTQSDTVDYIVTPPSLFTLGELDTIAVEVHEPREVESGEKVSYVCEDPPSPDLLIGEAQVTVMGRDVPCDTGDLNLAAYEDTGPLSMELLTPLVQPGQKVEFDVTLDFAHGDTGSEESFYVEMWVGYIGLHVLQNITNVYIDGENGRGRIRTLVPTSHRIESDTTPSLPAIETSGSLHLRVPFELPAGEDPRPRVPVTHRITVEISPDYYDSDPCPFFCDEECSGGDPFWVGSFVLVNGEFPGAVSQDLADLFIVEFD